MEVAIFESDLTLAEMNNVTLHIKKPWAISEEPYSPFESNDAYNIALCLGKLALRNNRFD